MLKVKLQDNRVVSFEKVEYTEAFIDLEETDNPVVDSDTGLIVAFRNSSQAKDRLVELSNYTNKTNEEEYELSLLEGYSADSFTYIVNITTQDNKKKATIIKFNINDKVELDEDRGDRGFNSIEEAQEYANTFNS